MFWTIIGIVAAYRFVRTFTQPPPTPMSRGRFWLYALDNGLAIVLCGAIVHGAWWVLQAAWQAVRG